MQKVHIDMEQLTFSFLDDSPDNNYYLDRDTGTVHLVHRGLEDLRDLTDEIETERERFLYVPKQDPKRAKDDLRDFIDTVDDGKLKVQFEMAMEGPHALSGFKKILKDNCGDASKLEEFLSGRTRLRIKQWLSANCIAAEETCTTEQSEFE